MDTIIKYIKRKIVRTVDYFAWQKQYKTLIAAPRKNNFSLDTDWYKGKKILVMVPHADDELISSYTVLRNADNLTVYYCGFTGSNKAEENRKKRALEILELCSELNIKIIEGDGKCDNLNDVLNDGRHDVILLPSIVDWHEEHRKISYMIGNACANLGIKPGVYTYSVTVPNESRRNVLCVPIDKKQLEEKYELFKKNYISQRFMPIERLILNDRINGYHAGCFAAECYVNYNFEEWFKVVKCLRPLEGKEEAMVMLFARDLKTNLNNLVSIRQISSRFYNWIEKGGEGWQ